MKRNDSISLAKQLKWLVNQHFGPGEVRISLTHSPPPARKPNLIDVYHAAAVIQRFCNSRAGDDACGYCPIRGLCELEPYLWVLPCTTCGKDAEPRIKCHMKGPVCVACCETCRQTEPFPCPDYDTYKKAGGHDVYRPSNPYV